MEYSYDMGKVHPVKHLGLLGAEGKGFQRDRITVKDTRGETVASLLRNKAEGMIMPCFCYGRGNEAAKMLLTRNGSLRLFSWLFA